MKDNLKVFVFSPTGSSLKLAKRFAKNFEDSDIIDLTIKDKINIKIENATAAFVFPVYAGRVPTVFLERLNGIKGLNSDAVIIAVYGNRHYDDAILEMRDIAEELGFKIVAAAAFLAEHSYSEKLAGGRPNTEDLEIMDAFADSITVLIELEEPKLPGNRPYRDGVGESTWAPYPTDSCIHCGVCGMVCPVGIINSDGSLPEENIPKCLHCLACVKRCPIGVRIADYEQFINLIHYLEKSFQKPNRVPEIFITL